MKPLPKSYLNGASREGMTPDMIYVAESLAAGDAGDLETSWAWLALADVPAPTLLFLKHQNGADFIRKWGFKTEEAKQLYGKDWLDK